MLYVIEFIIDLLYVLGTVLFHLWRLDTSSSLRAYCRTRTWSEQNFTLSRHIPDELSMSQDICPCAGYAGTLPVSPLQDKE